jgi:hypothetical protein
MWQGRPKQMIDGDIAGANERVWQGPNDHEPASQSELVETLWTETIVITDKATLDQIAAVMMQHGTPDNRKKR